MSTPVNKPPSRTRAIPRALPARDRAPENDKDFRTTGFGIDLTSVPAVANGLNTHGAPLDPTTRATMESRFGHDFSAVRTHTGPAADTSARTLRAHAYTLGADLVFRDDAYHPGTPRGNHLLAHELAHVVQQSRAVPGTSASESATEIDAHRAADAWAGTDAIRIAERSPVRVACQSEDERPAVATTDPVDEFHRYVKDSDWSRAAWELNTCAPAVIAAEVKRLGRAERTALVEGAYHGGKDNVVDAVTGVDATAAKDGAVRFYRWKGTLTGREAKAADAVGVGGARFAAQTGRLSDAARQLDGLEHRKAIKVTEGLLASGGIDRKGFQQLLRLSPNTRYRAGDTWSVDGVTYVVYESEVRFGGNGTRSSRNNNPGNLRRWANGKLSAGAIGTDSGEFQIFPDEATGVRALVDELRYRQLTQDYTLFEAMQTYASSHSDDPVAYAKQIAHDIGAGVTPGTKMKVLKQSQLVTMAQTIKRVEGGRNEATSVPLQSTALPPELRERLGLAEQVIPPERGSLPLPDQVFPRRTEDRP
ncbi:uncharacterized protein DUF4157 [Nocardia tenerifensis]|uniref:Uncharacterized protein DUF4157 n=1 Tax=Nocardia tenerifensis TaxID=228006 RepID=A0A318JUW7_9NOCA|nr:DUF4157 domain-containing protein [Nocardia tenerifensis]PXX60811.1 uncharacterized protein DUF4157 [Nocardia tenerifensis]